MKNYIESVKTFEQLSKEGYVNEAKLNNQFIICRMNDPYSPTMCIAVYDPNLKEINDLRAIFRSIDDARVFVECFE